MKERMINATPSTPERLEPSTGSLAAEKRPTLQMKSEQGTIAYDDTGGPGPLVIAVPGMGDLRTEYRYLSAYLVEAGFRVVTVDIRGHGASSVKWDDYSAHAVGRDLLALVANLGSQKAILIGNSFSAGSALWAAHDAPEKISAMVLIGPVLRDPPNGVPWYMRWVLSLGFGGPWRVPFWLMFWTTLFPTRKPDDFNGYRDALGANLREPGRMAALKAMVYLSKADTENMLEQSKALVFVIMGTKDADFSDPSAEAAWAAGRVGAKVLMVEGAGHYPHTEMPEQVGPAVVAYLRGMNS